MNHTDAEDRAEALEISRLGQRLEKTGSREVAIFSLVLWGVLTFYLFLLMNPNFVEKYEGMYNGMTIAIWGFAVGAFALKTYGSVQEQRTNAYVRRATNPRLPPDGDVDIAG